MIVPTLRVVMHPTTLCVAAMDAERPGRHPHAERGDDHSRDAFSGTGFSREEACVGTLNFAA
jgi:hypothetical protein